MKLKTEQELNIMMESGKRLRRVVLELLPHIQPGISTREIDEKADYLIQSEGGESSFKKVRNYRWSTCLPINEQIVHTPPSKRIVHNGDVITLDIGFYYKGYHTDYATTWIVGEKKDKDIQKFLDVGKKTLEKAIGKVRSGGYIGQISQTIESEIEKANFFVIPELTGHGIGRKLHEDPLIPGILDRPLEKTYKMRSGLAIAIEVIYSMGTNRILFEKGSDWSITTSDGSLSSCFEHTVVIKGDKTLILT